MSGTTSRFAFPYPSPTDPLKEGATKIKAFAEGADAAILNRSYGKSIVATEESRTNTAYGKLTTPDEVQVVMPQDGLIAVLYHALWKESVVGAGRAAIFIGANQLKGRHNTEPKITAAATGVTGESIFVSLASFGGGLASGNLPMAADVTTGQIVGISVFSSGQSEGGNVSLEYGGTLLNLPGTNSGPSGTGLLLSHAGGPCYIFAAAGTYTVSVQFKSSSGSVMAKNRKLWVWSMF